MATPDLTALDEETLSSWLLSRRWFGSKAEEVAHVGVLDSMGLDDADPALLLALIEARFPTGTHHVYQLLFGVRPQDEGWTEGRIEDVGGTTVYDDTYVLKAFRRLEAGDNPELEMLRFLTERAFPNVAELVGWIDYEGELMDATLGVAQRFVAGGRGRGGVPPREARP